MEEIVERHKESINAPALRFHCEHMLAGVHKAERELGYHAGTSVEEGMRRSLRWMVAQGLLRTEVTL